jgi:2-C-methyl-D-erythritol 4-phosphate cytidylyltransferase/2-C-methyl-D-erythritol 2,4-cyclodiphosphate synthase
VRKYQTIAIIVAAGSGSRVGGSLPKQYMPIGCEAVLHRTVKAFLSHPKIDAVRVIYNPNDSDLYEKAVADLDVLSPVTGGATRQESVRLGLQSILEFAPERVLIHDAARPFVSADIISNIIDALDNHKGAIPVIAVEDTLKKYEDGKVLSTVARDNLVRAQTPQGFICGDILDAHNRLAGQSFTDDAALFEHLGIDVATVQGSADNFKITTMEDFQRAEKMLNNMRVGTGFDVHKFCSPKSADNTIMLCGIAVPHAQSLDGHSDADVGLHAIVDAILGALAMGDIGEHFPPSDNKYKGMDSAVFLEFARDLLAQKRATISNIDVTIICERPKLGDYKKAMAARVAEILGISANLISVKATTTEGLGFTGRGEGIAAQAMVLVKVV